MLTKNDSIRVQGEVIQITINVNIRVDGKTTLQVFNCNINGVNYSKTYKSRDINDTDFYKEFKELLDAQYTNYVKAVNKLVNKGFSEVGQSAT